MRPRILDEILIATVRPLKNICLGIPNTELYIERKQYHPKAFIVQSFIRNNIQRHRELRILVTMDSVLLRIGHFKEVPDGTNSTYHHRTLGYDNPNYQDIITKLLTALIIRPGHPRKKLQGNAHRLVEPGAVLALSHDTPKHDINETHPPPQWVNLPINH